MEQVVIMGSGCAGLTAAIYAARACLEPLVIEGVEPGGQIVVSNEVENYPGFPEGITGTELMQQFRRQAERFGARFQSGEAESVERKEDYFEVQSGDERIETRSLIVATGAVARRLGVPGEDRFYGKGVSGCATCDGFFFKEMPVVVVGGGNTAIDDALFLTRFAEKVTIVHRRDYLRAAQVQVEKAKAHSKIEWMIPYVVEEILGDDAVTGVRVKNRETGDTGDIACKGVFVAIGHDPSTKAIEGLVETDENGFVVVEPGSTRTDTAGLFVCGDVRDPVYKQAVVAAGHGCMAAMDAQHYLEALANDTA